MFRQDEMVFLEDRFIPAPDGGESLSSGSLESSAIFHHPGGTFDIVLHLGSGLAGNTAAAAAFERAAQFWEEQFTDPVTVNIDAELNTNSVDGDPFSSADILGSARTAVILFAYHDVRQTLIQDASDDESIVQQLPNSTGQLTFNLPSHPDEREEIQLREVTDEGIVTRSAAQNTAGNPLMTVSRANALALGFSELPGTASAITPGVTRDSAISFNSAFTFDFDRSDGITSSTTDFEAVALHEIGHALGFTSSVDDVDFFVDQDDGVANNIYATPMDLFRLEPGQGEDFSTAARILNTGNNVSTQVFHDGQFDISALSGAPGVSALQTGDIPMSTGPREGDGNQASHFKADEITGVSIGLLDPSLTIGAVGQVRQPDLRVLGLVGWDWQDNASTLSGTVPTVTVDLLATSDTTPPLSGTVSEPDADVFVRLAAIHGSNTATLLVDGNSFTSDAFTLSNASNSSARIVRMDLVLPNTGQDSPQIFFDTTGVSSQDFLAVAADVTAVGLQSPESDGVNDEDVRSRSETLTLLFNDFGPNESISWRIDMDGDDADSGDALINGLVIVEYDNGVSMSNRLAAVSGNANASSTTLIADHYLKATVDESGNWSIADNTLPTLALGPYDVETLVVDSSGAQATDVTIDELVIQTDVLVEFDRATASDPEASGEDLPLLSVLGTLALPAAIDVTVNGGTATSADFTNTATVTIPAGSYDGTLSTAVATNLSIIDDVLLEQSETIDLTLVSPTGALIIDDADGDSAIQNTHSYTITDDDLAAFTIDDVTVDEDGGTLDFTLSLDNPLDISVDVDVAFSDVTATGVGTDYTSTAQQITFNAEDAADKTVSVSIAEDVLVEGVETFLASLSTLTALGGRVVDLSDAGTGTIMDNDLLGDMDLDGDVDFDDINDFVMGLVDEQGYETIFGVPPDVRGDMDGDGDHDFDDIDEFVALLISGLSSSVRSDLQGPKTDNLSITVNDNVLAISASISAISVTPSVWVDQGPATVRNGQVENVVPNNQITGAIHTVLSHPTDPDILYIGAVNGGIWKTNNATVLNPVWLPQSDFLSSLSIGAMAFDRSDATNNTLVADTAKYSSFGGIGGSRGVIYRTTDGGDTWTDAGGAGLSLTSGENISGIAARGNTIVVTSSANFGGIYRSTDGGANFTPIDGLDFTSARDDFFDLVEDPSDLTGQRLYAAGEDRGIYRSDNFGSNWTKISGPTIDAEMDDLLTDPANNNIEMAVHPTSGRLYVALLLSGQPMGIFFTNNASSGSSSWTRMDVPVLPLTGATTISGASSTAPIEITSASHVLSTDDFVVISGVTGNTAANGFFRITVIDADTFSLDASAANGTYEGGGTWTQVTSPNPTAKDIDETGAQGRIHFSIRVDPTDEDIVYVGGDRQVSNDPIGDNSFSGAIFRGDAGITRDPTVASSPQWDHITHDIVALDPAGGTASGSAPHADSREMVFDANGDLIEVDDGGIFRRTRPRDNSGDWFSLAGTLAVVEFHDIAYDSNSNTIIGGSQDNGTPFQLAPDGKVWEMLSGGDGGDVAVDAITLAASNQSIRYSSFQDLGGFRRTVWDANNNRISTTFPLLIVTGGGARWCRNSRLPSN